MNRLPLRNFYEATRDAKKIIVPDLGFLGDTVLLVPALWEIKDHYPQAEMHVVSAPVGAEVLRIAPCVDRAWAVTLDPAKRSLREQWQLVQALRREKFDVAFSFGGADRVTILAALTGARWRVAHSGGRSHFWNKWLIANWAPRQDRDLPVYEQRRGFLADCGFNLHPPRFDLRVDDSAVRAAAGLAPSGALHISLNSATPFNEWPVGHYASMLKELWVANPTLPVVASGSAKPREIERLRRLKELVNDKRLIILDKVLSIAQLAAVLQRCRVHFGPDSGVVHLARALGIPTVALYREQSGYKSFLAPSPRHRAITFPCACLTQRTATCQASGEADCFAQIQPAQVTKLIAECLTN